MFICVCVCVCVWLPPDLADTAQYSALISSDSLMASSSTWDSWSGDWGVKQTDRSEEIFRPSLRYSEKKKSQLTEEMIGKAHFHIRGFILGSY